jgi:isoleucyl-tRNA synthetase
VSIEVDTSLSDEQILEGLSREVMRKVQQARKNADLKLDARIHLSIHCDGKLLEAVKAHEATLKSETLAQSLVYAANADAVTGKHKETATDIEEGQVTIGITVA